MKSKLKSIAAILAILFPVWANATGQISDKRCPFDAAKVNAAVKAKIMTAFLIKIPFWNELPPNVNCKPDSEMDRIACRITFSADDGTKFYMDDNGGGNKENAVHMDLGFRLAADDEGNYIQPLTCETYLPDVGYFNLKTNVGWRVGESLEIVSYLK
jgi:hypothetical protein